MSWVEVEAKIKVKDSGSVRNKIRKIANFVEKEKKVDDYYALNYGGKYPRKSLRVRHLNKKVEVNFKQWISYKFGVHAKKEVEFGVTDLENFFDLLRDFGFRKWLSKEKVTELYRTKDRVNIELNKVKGLGWFIEIEILCKENEIKKTRKKILGVFDKLDLKKGDIERKGYTKMLWNLRKSGVRK